MIAYFPKFHDDELLYSVIARYGVYTRQTGSRLLLKDLFGIDSMSPSVDLPTGLGHLVSKINPRIAIDVGTIINNHTMFNYYYALADKSHREKIFTRMVHYIPGESKPINRRPSLINESRYLRFCPECRVEMMREFGEAYWKRTHQIPLALYCSRHERILVESPFAIASGYKAFNALNEDTPAKELCPATRAAVNACKTHLPRLGKLSENYLEDCGFFDNQSRTPQYYRLRLMEKNLCRSAKSIDVKALEIRSKDFFAALFDVWAGLRFQERFMEITLVRPLRIKSRKMHIAYHIILQDFIDQQTALRAEDNPRDFSALNLIDWPCLNTVAMHTSKPNVKITRSKRVANYNILHFTCECGYSYIRRRYASGEYHKPRLVCFGPTIVPVIHKAQKQGWSIRRIGRELGIRHMQVVVEAARQGIAIEPDVRRSLRKPRAKIAPGRSDGGGS